MNKIVYSEVDKEKLKKSRNRKETVLGEKDIKLLLKKFQDETFGVESIIELSNYGKRQDFQYEHINNKEIVSGEAIIEDNKEVKRNISFSIFAGKDNDKYHYDQVEIVLDLKE